jgi:hypothetical protein
MLRRQLVVRSTAWLTACVVARSCLARHGTRRLASKTTVPKSKRPKRNHKIPAFEDNFKTDDEEQHKEALHFLLGQYVCPGSEMDVKIVKVTKDYALCRPLAIPEAKGKINKEEMDEYGEVWDATTYVSPNMIYTASVRRIQPPDRLIFSLRRVRRVLRDDFQPFTIAIFGLPADFYEDYEGKW